MPFNIGAIELILLFLFIPPSTAGFGLWHAKRQVAAMRKPRPEVDENRQPLASH